MIAERGTRSQASFAWTSGVKALCLLLVEYRLWGLHSDPSDFEFRGRAGSPAASLDAALGKRLTNLWLQNLFGPMVEGSEWQFGRLLVRTNPDGKRKSAPYGLRLVTTHLPTDQIDIHLGSRRLEAREEIEGLLRHLQSQWQGKPNEHLVGRAKLGVSSDRSVETLLESFEARGCRWEAAQSGAGRVFAFTRLHSRAALFRQPHENPSEVLLFSPEELVKELPLTPPVAAQVKDRLRSRGWCYVDSLGATGKTTLAGQLAVEGQVAEGPCFHASLEGAESKREELLAEMERLSKQAVLLVLDDVHRSPQLAELLLASWESAAPKAKLLLLGRYRSRGLGGLAQDRVLTRLQSDGLRLTVDPGEMPALLKIHLARVNQAAPQQHAMSPPATARWHRLFAADLGCLAHVVARRHVALAEGDQQVWPDDAADFIRQHCLGPLHPEAQTELQALALFSAYDLDVPELALDGRLLSGAADVGVVCYRPGESGMSVRVCNPGLAELLLEAASSRPGDAELFVRIANRFPAFGLLALQFMEAAGDLALETQPFLAAELTVHRLLQSPAMLAWAKANGFAMVSKMIAQHARRGFQPQLLRRQLAQQPTVDRQWPFSPSPVSKHPPANATRPPKRR